MPSLSAWPARCAESWSITSSSSARTTFDASSSSTCVSTTRDGRTKPSGTSSRFHVIRRLRVALTQSLCSPDSIMTTGASPDDRNVRCLRADGICSHHGPRLLARGLPLPRPPPSARSVEIFGLAQREPRGHPGYETSLERYLFLELVDRRPAPQAIGPVAYGIANDPELHGDVVALPDSIVVVYRIEIPRDADVDRGHERLVVLGRVEGEFLHLREQILVPHVLQGIIIDPRHLDVNDFDLRCGTKAREADRHGHLALLDGRLAKLDVIDELVQLLELFLELRTFLPFERSASTKLATIDELLELGGVVRQEELANRRDQLEDRTDDQERRGEDLGPGDES